MLKDDRWHAVVGIPLDTTADDLTIRVGDSDVAVDIVQSRSYREQRLTVKNKSYVSPGQAQLERIGRERQIIDAALARFRVATAEGIDLAAPVAGTAQFEFRACDVFSTSSRVHRTRAWTSLLPKERRFGRHAAASSRRPATIFSTATP